MSNKRGSRALTAWVRDTYCSQSVQCVCVQRVHHQIWPLRLKWIKYCHLLQISVYTMFLFVLMTVLAAVMSFVLIIMMMFLFFFFFNLSWWGTQMPIYISIWAINEISDKADRCSTTSQTITRALLQTPSFCQHHVLVGLHSTSYLTWDHISWVRPPICYKRTSVTVHAW